MVRFVLGARAMLRLLSACCLIGSATANAGSLELFVNDIYDYDYGRQLTLPPSFGAGEFTLEVWIRPNAQVTVGPDRRTQWSATNEAPNSSAGWWYDGNFLLDGHN